VFLLNFLHFSLRTFSPALRRLAVTQMIDNPFETKSDSFYFVNDRLIMHNKASYKVSSG
jgi:hypothetical protein